MKKSQEKKKKKESNCGKNTDYDSDSCSDCCNCNSKTKKVEKVYTLNKKKVRKRITAFTRLSISRKHLYFYSLSFPEGLKDGLAYEVFNIFLTRLRTEEMIENYVWIAERQENQTIHFHLVRCFPIRRASVVHLWIQVIDV